MAGPDPLSHATPARPVLRATWSGWTATVRPGVDSEVSVGDECILACIAAGALGVHEAFEALRNRPGSDAGYRDVTLNLWHPGMEGGESGPPLLHAAAAWWVLGLGHLGQAYSWVISWLPYDEPGQVAIVVQDFDRTTPSTHSTGILTPKGVTGVRKTRVVKQALRAAGFDLAVIERRFHGDLRIQPDECHVALIGVDNLPTRRLLSHAGWRLAIDVGLGAGPSDYSSLVLRRFPGVVPSDQVSAWAQAPRPTAVPNTPAFADLENRGDSCGAVTLAGKAVGACFVGVVAACYAVAEAVRELHGGGGLDVLALDLSTNDLRTAAAVAPSDVISRRFGPDGRRVSNGP